MSRPRHHANSSKTLFKNPWQTPDDSDANDSATPESVSESQAETGWLSSLTGGLPSLLSNIPIEWARDLSAHGISPTKVVKPDFNKFAKSDGTVKATWLGHASYLIELPLIFQKDSIEPVRVLFDPMFSDRAGPSTWTGIRRRLPSPCTITQLPEFQFVLISHNHYDHLDLPSIHEIVRTRGRSVSFLVPLGIKDWLLSLDIPKDQVYELDWWDEVVLPRPCTESDSDPESALLAPSVTFVCVPAQHSSGRNVLDKCTTLWCGWVVKQASEHSRANVYHAGDTGYIGTNDACPVFEEIGERCGPIDLAILPIWRGGTLSFISQMGLRLTHHPLLSAMHASPADAVAIHRAVRARHALAMHFGTFAGSEAEALEPLVELARARKEAGLGEWWDDGGIGAIDIGETVEIKVERREEGKGEDGNHDGIKSV